MSEKRFELQHINDLTDKEYMRLKKITDNGELITLGEVVDLLNEQQATIKDLERKLQICSAHLLSDECCLTDGQIREIIKEMTNE